MPQPGPKLAHTAMLDPAAAVARREPLRGGAAHVESGLGAFYVIWTSDKNAVAWHSICRRWSSITK